MLKQNWKLISRIERIGDFLIVIFCFFLAYYGRSSFIHWNKQFGLALPFVPSSLAPLKDYFIVLGVALLGYILSLSMLGAYNSMRLRSSWFLLRISFLSSVTVFIALASIAFLLKLDLSRSFILLFCVLTTLALSAERYLVLEFLRFWRKRGRNFRNVIICGVGDQAVCLAEEIVNRPELGIRVRGFADLRMPFEDHLSEYHQFRNKLQQVGCRRTGRIIRGEKEFSRALEEYAIDEVLFCDLMQVMTRVREMIGVCAELGVRTTIAADVFSMGMAQSQISSFGGMPLIHFQTPPGDHWHLTLKRWIDVVVSGILLVLFSPIFLIIAACIKLSGPGPVFFVQRRVGLNGRIFRLYKFRSMILDAEELLPDLQEQNEMEGPVFKMSKDPRVTRFGRILRRFSLDELPQLFNVFVGDMSLVGPRPPVPGEVSCYERRDRRRLSMRPGMTCTWQVSGRNNIRDFESWVKMDLDYIDNWSLGRDLTLMFRTLPAVLFGEGAS